MELIVTVLIIAALVSGEKIYGKLTAYSKKIRCKECVKIKEIA